MIGDKIREIRKNKDMTLNELAVAAGVTASYISQLERNIIDPSISSLRKIAGVLEVPIYTFLDDEGKEPILVKADKRQKLELHDSNIVYEYITPIASTAMSNTKMEIIYFQLDPKGWSSDVGMQHKADECILLLKGSIKVYLGEDIYDLDEGDSIYIRENVPHRMYNHTNKKVSGIFCITPVI